MITTEKIANYIIDYCEDNHISLSNRKLAALTVLFYGYHLLSNPSFNGKDSIVIDKDNSLISTEVLNGVFRVSSLPFAKLQVKSNEVFGWLEFKAKREMSAFMEKHKGYTEQQLYFVFFDKIIDTQVESNTILSFTAYKSLFESLYVNHAIDVPQSLLDFQSLDKITTNEISQLNLLLSRVRQQYSMLLLLPIQVLLTNNTLNMQNPIVNRTIKDLSSLLSRYATISTEITNEEVIDVNKQLLNMTEELKTCVMSKTEFIDQLKRLDKYYEVKKDNTIKEHSNETQSN